MSSKHPPKRDGTESLTAQLSGLNLGCVGCLQCSRRGVPILSVTVFAIPPLVLAPLLRNCCRSLNTEDVTLISHSHGRERRAERAIDRIELQVNECDAPRLISSPQSLVIHLA